eukprot:TRINITY_DN41602_c0_g1_i1.p1 TRINITY_DN41602_c0_g1~~TRINITY_DN41602_c0_g1_i1.p1  ORF type:complete len:139 (-),score=12.46 TRINITY_DN41602_c0_g1_i1:471-887(-)
MSHKVRDLDYVNPRQKLPSVAMPPEVRAQLRLGPRQDCRPSAKLRSSSSSLIPSSLDGIRERLATGDKSEEVYVGRANVALGELAGSGKAGAGSDWMNASGHAFVRRGTAQNRLEGLRERATEARRDLSVSVGRRRGL